MNLHSKIAFAFVTAALVVGAAALSLTGGSASAQSGSGANGAAGPEVIAIKFHADWCGYCKAMGPIFDELQSKYDQEPVLYVVFDQTRDFDRRQSQYLASAMSLDSIWAEHGGKTGFILLIDADTGEIIERLNHQQGLKDMGAALQRAIRQAS